MKGIEIIKKLASHGHEAYVIGGAVRDRQMGLKVKDVDIVTSATPDQILRLFRDDNIKEVGKAFGVIILNGIEVATYRKDRYEGFNDKAVEVTYAKTLLEDVSRRDLTINTIAWNPLTNEIIDHFNGLEDLRNKVIKFVGSPLDRIAEDPNRILRACRFAAKINGTIEPETKAALKEFAYFVKKYVAPERIYKEVLAAIKIKKASLFFYLLRELGILKDIFPSLDTCFGHKHGRHHSEDVFAHQMMAGDHVSTKHPLVKMAAYLHDVGKPASYDPVGQTFYDHEDIGAELLARELRALKFSNEELVWITSLVKLHMLFHFEHPTPRSVRRVLRKLHDSKISFRDLLRIYDADLCGNLNRASEHRASQFANLLAVYRVFSPELHRKEPVHALAFLKLNGNDVCRIAGIQPGKQVGQLLNHLLEAVIEDPELNTVQGLTGKIIEFTANK